MRISEYPYHKLWLFTICATIHNDVASVRVMCRYSRKCTLQLLESQPTILWSTDRTQVGVLLKAEWGRGEQESEPSVPLCSMPARGPELIQHIMSKLLLAAAPIETLIKAIRGSSWGGAGGWEDVVNSG